MSQTFSYDTLGRPTRVKIFDDTAVVNDIELEYAPNGRLDRAIDHLDAGAVLQDRVFGSKGETLSIAYDNNDRVENDYHENLKVSARRYYVAGSLVAELGFDYDERDRLAAVRLLNKNGASVDEPLYSLEYVGSSETIYRIAYGNGLTRTIEPSPSRLEGQKVYTDSGSTDDCVRYPSAPIIGCVEQSGHLRSIGPDSTHTVGFGARFNAAFTDFPIDSSGAQIEETHALKNGKADGEEAFWLKQSNMKTLRASGHESGDQHDFDWDAYNNLVGRTVSEFTPLDPENPVLLAQTSGGAFGYSSGGLRLDSAFALDGGNSLSYANDAAGRVTQKGSKTISWDRFGGVTQMSDSAAGDVVDIIRGPLGRVRSISRMMGADTLDESYRADGSVVTRTLNGASSLWLDFGVGKIELDGTGEIYRHFDYRNNVQFLTDEGGRVITLYRYQPFGLHQILGDDMIDFVRFAGGRQLSNARDDFVLLGRRVLDSTSGRFLSPDPRYHAVNLFGYTDANPIDSYDPSGEFAITVNFTFDADFRLAFEGDFGSDGLAKLSSIPGGNMSGGGYTGEIVQIASIPPPAATQKSKAEQEQDQESKVDSDSRFIRDIRETIEFFDWLDEVEPAPRDLEFDIKFPEEPSTPGD